MSKHLRVSFCIRCMGRLHHLRETLPRNILDNADYPHLEFLVLDYNSRDGLEDWIRTEMEEHLNSGLIRFVQTREPRFFHSAHANNLAHRAATGEALCNLDADNFTGPGFAAWINTILSADRRTVGASFGRCRNRSRIRSGTEGRIFLHREWFDALGGYDENYKGYSWSDYDLVERARNAGLRVEMIPEQYLDCIPHSLEERSRRLMVEFHQGIRENTHAFRTMRNATYQEMLMDSHCALEG